MLIHYLGLKKNNSPNFKHFGIFSPGAALLDSFRIMAEILCHKQSLAACNLRSPQ